MLPPHEFEAFLFGQILLDGVVGPLNEHAVEADAFEDVCHGRAHTKRINGPAVAVKEK